MSGPEPSAAAGGSQAKTAGCGGSCRSRDADRSALYQELCALTACRSRAIRLLELGARASLVCQLMSLPKATVKAWYQQIHGRPSPPGLNPFSDSWYVQTEQRMLHSNIVWKLGCRIARALEEPAHRLLEVYESYVQSVATPVLDITRVYFVPRLLLIGSWRTMSCRECVARYIGPVTDVEQLCPACKLQRMYRCAGCGASLGQKGVGRRASRCCRCLRGRGVTGVTGA